MHNRKSHILKVAAIIILLFVVFINSKSLNNPIRLKLLDSSGILLEPFKAVADFIHAITPYSSLQKENELLRNRINLLSRKLEEAKGIYIENQRLKVILDFKKSISYTVVPSQVIGRDPSNWSNTLIIDKGSINGVEQNKAVISPRGVVGRVVEVGRYSSRILLITDPSSKVGVLVQRNRQGGILVGMPDGKCKMIYIALDSDVMPGDKVITAGSGAVFPKDLLVGQVAQVGKEPGLLYKYAIVKTAEDLSRLEEVLCTK